MGTVTNMADYVAKMDAQAPLTHERLLSYMDTLVERVAEDTASESEFSILNYLIDYAVENNLTGLA